ncbi:MAG: UDP-N-acetylmuramoyl-L-alanine--D-glutamate ligase, partial [Verrucomicrobiales bacterium]|nr:UDP-N-acetylmuramoyl-L-alanine--D-glutamate ligase [Verrucomicrobiales bacterium]
AVCDVVKSPGGSLDVLTIEVSSFQLELVDTFRAKVAVWMNFAPDHLDRHPDVKAYRAAKLRVFENQRGDDLAVIRWGENVGVLAANTVTFSGFESCGEYGLEGRRVMRGGVALLDLGETKLRGKHNAENVMAAWAVGREFGIDDRSIANSVVDYTPPAHRCELVARVGGVDYVNDSKATNLHALESALVSLDGRVVLIAGGKQKGLDYRPLTDLVASRAKRVILIGQIADELREAWGEVVECEVSGDLDAAVKAAAEAADEGEVVLFSPGTSSFDMFSGYGERGEAFREAVAKIS